MVRDRCLGITSLLLTALLPPQLSGQGTFGERVSVTVVEVPVQVLRDGEPVAGLTADDFEVYDEGQLRELSGFEVVDLGEPRAVLGSAEDLTKAPARRNLLLFFDLGFSGVRDLGRAITAARELLASQITPGDRVAIATYDRGSGAQLLIGFTDDRALLGLHLDFLAAVLSADPKKVEEKRAALAEREEPAASSAQAARISRLAARIGGAGAIALDGRLPTFTPPVASIASLGDLANGGLLGIDRDDDRFAEGLNGIAAASATELTQQYVETAVRRGVINAVRAFSDSLSTLIKLLGDVEGQRVLLYLSNGFPNIALSEQTLASTLENLLADFRRSGWAIHAVDLAGVPPPTAQGGTAGGVGFSANSLLYLAKGTGGAVYENFNRLAAATELALTRTRLSYRLTFTRADLPADGKFRKLEVRVKEPRGLTVVHRPGYHAPRPAAEQNELDRRLARAEELLGPAEGGELELSVFAAALPADEGGRIPLWLEVRGPSLLESIAITEGAPPLRIDVQAYLLRDGDTVTDLLAQELSLDPARVAGNLKTHGLRFYGELLAPPGEYRLRVRVENLATARSSVRSVPLRVVAAGTAAPSLFPPVFPDLEGGWVVTRQTPVRDAGGESAYPLRLGSRDVLPQVAPSFAPGTKPAVLLLLADAGQRVGLASRVLRENGTLDSRAVLTLLDRSAPDARGLSTVLATLDISKLSAGRYTLEVRAESLDSKAHCTTASTFVIPGR